MEPMALDLRFDLFRQDEKGPLWQASFMELDDAKRQAQKLADAEGYEFFIFDYGTASEVARAFPTRRKPNVPLPGAASP
jgi:hypothetical protein